MKGGEVVAVFGCGPVGVMAMKSAWIKGASRVIGIDHLNYRLEIARKSAKAEVINFKETDPAEIIREMTNGRGADVVVDAVGMEADRSLLEKAAQLVHLEAGTLNAFKMCVRAARRGGRISVVGVYGTTYDNFPFGQIFDKGLKVIGGQAPVQAHIDNLMSLVKDKKVVLDDIISHKFPLEKIAEAYQIFNNKEDNCMKVILKPHG
jgi:alcohol dehydrogenase